MHLLCTPFAFLVLLQGGQAGTPADTEKGKVAELLKHYVFVFNGTVRKLKATTMAAVKPTDRTIVVKVDKVLQPATKVGKRYEGKEITVDLTDNQPVEVGKQGVFYTNSLVSGESLAVRGIVNFNPEHPSVTAAAVQAVPTEAIRAALEKADTVVVGKVVDVREPAAQVLNAGGAPKVRVSEHAAYWQEAVIDVQSVEKGDANRNKQVVVLFPRSQDVRWKSAPKFEKGQEGAWLLHRNQTTNVQVHRWMGALAASEKEGYTALKPSNFYPKDQVERMRAVLNDLKEGR
jgi:hypothetical protein